MAAGVVAVGVQLGLLLTPLLPCTTPSLQLQNQHKAVLTAVSAQHLFILVVVEMLVLVEVILGHLPSGSEVEHCRREGWLSPVQCCVFCCNCVPVTQELRSAGRPYRRRTPAHQAASPVH